MAAEHRELAERMPEFLSAEQTRAFGQLLSQQLESLRNHTQQLRRTAGIALEEVLDTEDAERERLGNTQLQFTLRINGSAFTKTVTSTRGNAVTFETPAGLWVEAQPQQSRPDRLQVEVWFYESAGDTRRLVGQTYVSASITNPRQHPELEQVGSGSNTVLRGRKAYVLACSVEATYL
jgi:hypothetical protein